MTDSNIQILANNLLDSVDLITHDEDPLYPVTNLQIAQTSLKWRSTSTSEQQIIADLIQFESVSGWSLNGNNLDFGSTVRMSLYTSVARDINVSDITWAGGIATVTFSQLHGLYDDTKEYALYVKDVGGAVELNDKVWDCTVINTNTVSIEIASMTAYTSGGTGTSLIEVYDESQDGLPVQYGWGEQPWGLGGWYGYGDVAEIVDEMTFWFKPVTTDFMRVIINDANNSDGYIEAGRLYMGLALEPKYNFLWGAGINYKSQTRVQRTRSGSLISDNLPSFREASIKLSYMSEQEAMLMLDMIDSPGLRSDAVISMYPDHLGTLGQKTTILGRFISHSAITRDKRGYNISFTFQEAL